MGETIYLDHYLGPLDPYLEATDITDIYINRPNEIWVERYQMWPEPSDRSGARFICSSEGLTFKDACKKANELGEFKEYGDFDPQRLSLWGCRLFDNESEARASFG